MFDADNPQAYYSMDYLIEELSTANSKSANANHNNYPLKESPQPSTNYVSSFSR
jgi:hypothetical protein